MEQLIATVFSHIASHDFDEIAAALRRLEVFLAKLQLQSSQSTTRSNGSSSSESSSGSSASKDSKNVDNLPLRCFLKLQSDVKYNVTFQLVKSVAFVISQNNTDQTNSLLTAATELLQGLLLLHPSSRNIFAEESSMGTLLRLLHPTRYAPEVHSIALRTLVCALLGRPNNIRTFESINGPGLVVKLFRASHSPEKVKFQCMEVFYFYLMEESDEDISPPSSSASSPVGTMAQTPQKKKSSRPVVIKSVDEKRQILLPLLPNVDDLISDLKVGLEFDV